MTTFPTEYLQCCRAVVTGASGFLGRQIVESLIGAGARVLGVDANSGPDTVHWKEIEQSDLYRHAKGSIADADGITTEFLARCQPQNRLCFHMAGLADASLCEQNPDKAREVNVGLTRAVIRIFGAAGGQVLLFPSTGLVYGDSPSQACIEDQPPVPATIYARTKLAAEAIVRAGAEKYGFKAVIIRLSNVYGPGYARNTVIGRIIDQAMAKHPIRVFREEPVRDFIHSRDAVAAMLSLILTHPLQGTEICNVSTGIGTSIGELVKLAAGLFDVEHRPPEQVIGDGAAISRIVLDNRKLKRLTGWRPTVSLPEGLREIFEQGTKDATTET